ncbi:hypothetical protein SAMN04488063_1445 [Halopelagius inordinatus]|uniref:YHS domain-containing protein n=1 Tax=Halopelagius inordinatus TaxID=553467 RepID=A0A1I2PAB7_9EURY|nr:hypothetical protein [Halopelagius inordinatus]SFG10897.1 hypothetical protein SAMN04488063_1445 [Halopelagius inordinatus]
MAANRVTNFEVCAHCGSEFERGVRYPVVTVRTEDGGPLFYSFCDDDCKAAWLESRTDE